MSPMEDLRKPRKTKEKGKEATRSTFKGFVNYPLNEKQREELSAYAEQLPDDYEVLNDFIISGYKVSLSYDEPHQAFIATATGLPGYDHPNEGLALSARGPSFSGTVAALHYKVFRALDTRNWGDLLRRADAVQEIYE